MNQIDLEKAILDPAAVFERPEDVVDMAAFTRAEKIAILKSWAYDARELEVAQEEGMAGTSQSLLKQVLTSLRRLTGELDVEHPAPTKHHPLDD
jgi:hypothetical protein